MAKTDKVRKPRKKRVFKKRKNAGTGRASNKMIKGSLPSFSTLDPFPQFYNCCVTYAGRDVLTSSATQGLFGTEYTWKLNSVYDPYNATTPTQLNKTANGVPQLTNLYGKYKVKACLIEVEFADPSASSMVCGVMIKQPSATASVIQGVGIGPIEARPQCWTESISNTGSRKKVFRQFLRMHNCLGVTKQQFNANVGDYGSLINSDPSTLAYIALAVADRTSGAGSPTCFFTIKIKYYTQFYDRYQLTQG